MKINGKTLPNNPMKAYMMGKLHGTKENMDLLSLVLQDKFGWHTKAEDARDTMSLEYLQDCLVELVDAKNNGYVSKRDIADTLLDDYKMVNTAE